MNEWLERVTRELGLMAPLSDEEADALLKIARIAAHDGDDRRNAPLLTYLVGRGERSATEILEDLKRIS
jgi:hypothetical protein